MANTAGRRGSQHRASLVPEDAIAIDFNSPSFSPSKRRGSQAFLMGDEVILVNKRRLSSRTSFCTTSSNDDTQADDEDDVMQHLFLQKDLISNIKTQTWPMHRKLKVLRRAKLYIKKHEGELKQSKQAKDIMAKYKAYMEKSISKLKREIANWVVQLTPWEMRIKKIESQFGSVVASYFTFLRWVFWINTFITVFLCSFLMVPEVLQQYEDPTGMRKEVKDQESALTLQSIWDFEGYLKFSPIFYGYYSNREATDIGYRLPLAYFLALVLLYMFSFFCILRKMTQTARMSKAGAEADEYVFSWKLFTGWDYMIGNSETAYNKVASIVMGFKEVILEEKERKKEEKQDWKMLTVRIIANIFVLFLLGSSAYAVVLVVERSQDMPENPGWVRENELTLVVSGVGFVYPNIFNIIGVIESYHPGIQLQWQLARILVLNLLNLYTLMFSLFGKVDLMTAALTEMKYNMTVDKRYRMSTEVDVTVTVMTERAERAERSLDEEMMAIEGRYYWREPPPTQQSKKGQQPMDVIEERTTWMSGSTTTTTTTPPPPVEHRPVYFKEHYSPGGSEYDTNDIHFDTIEGRRRVPAFAKPGTRRPGRPDPGREATTPGAITRKATSYPGPKSTWTDATTASSTSQTTSRTWSQTPRTGTSRQPSTMEEGPVEFSTSTTLVADFQTTLPPERMTTISPVCGPSEEEILSKIAIHDEDMMLLSDEEKENMRTLCWETMFGQELTKLTVMDLVLTVVTTVIGDFFRAVIVRYCNGKACFFWDLEKGFPGYSDFPIAENILHLVNNQGMVWLGMFFAPGLPAINTIKLCIMMYVRSWAVLTCNIPHETVFKASGNNFYYALLLLMLFICALPVCYSCVWLSPSWHCGPFSDYERVYHILTKYIESKLPEKINKIVDYLTSPGTIVPLLLLLVLIIYWLLSTVANLKDANNDLKLQLRKDKDMVMEDGGPRPDGEPPVTEKKHVRINEEIDTNSISEKKVPEALEPSKSGLKSRQSSAELL